MVLNLKWYYFYKKSYIGFTIIKKICIIMMLNSTISLQATDIKSVEELLNFVKDFISFRMVLNIKY